jgi:hypothetical protein
VFATLAATLDACVPAFLTVAGMLAATTVKVATPDAFVLLDPTLVPSSVKATGIPAMLRLVVAVKLTGSPYTPEPETAVTVVVAFVTLKLFLVLVPLYVGLFPP